MPRCSKHRADVGDLHTGQDGGQDRWTPHGRRAYLVYEAGAFPGSPVNAGAQCIFSPYDIPNARVEGYDGVVNKPKAAAYRAPGAQGGAVQGIGWALNEEYVFNTKGAMLNASFLDYRMPTSLDLPMIDTVLVEVTNPGHPFGLRGVGEVPIVPPMAAIANAIYRATSVRMRQLPMSPSKV